MKLIELCFGFDLQQSGGRWHCRLGLVLCGAASIARVGATLHHDGFIDPVDLDDNDRFALDGQRLLLKTGTYGQAGSSYQTEHYSN